MGADRCINHWWLRTDAFGNATCAASGACAALGATACSDGKVCTVDSCDPKAGCKHPTTADKTGCGGAKTCVKGVCG